MKNQRVLGNRSGLAARRCDGRDGGQATDGCDDSRALAGFRTRGGGFGGLFAAGVCGDLDIAGAAAMKLKLEEFEARNVAEMSQAFDAAKRADVDAVMVPSSPFLAANTKLMADLASSHALPAVTLSSEFARNGGLMSYGPNTLDIYRHLGGLAAKVLQGRQPSELPVELPTKFELVLNLKTARALKLEIPATLLIRADEVIE
jgi:putative ABC transport system substrate-binding protein